MDTVTENPKVEKYLARARVAMRGMPGGEVEDALRELRSHIAELAAQDGGNAEAALESLGDPVELAKKYQADNQIVHAECSRSPLAILLGLRHASRTRIGQRAATALYVFGYFNAFAFLAVAVDKLFTPSKVGLWYTPGNTWSLTLVTDGNRPDGSHELMGWWIVPAAVLICWLLRYITDRIAQWWIRRYRRRSAAQEA